MSHAPIPSTLIEKLQSLGLNVTAIRQIAQVFDAKAIEHWADFAMDAVIQGATLETSAAVFFLERIQRSNPGNRLPPAWWKKMIEIHTVAVTEQHQTSAHSPDNTSDDENEYTILALFGGLLFLLIWSIYACFHGSWGTAILLAVALLAAVWFGLTAKKISLFGLPGIIIWGTIVGVYLWKRDGTKSEKIATSPQPVASAPVVAVTPVVVPDDAERRREPMGRARAAFERSEQADDRNDLLSAVDEMNRCVDALREAESVTSPTDTGYVNRLKLDIQKESNMALLICVRGVMADTNEAARPISDKWMQRIDKLKLPQPLSRSTLRNPIVGRSVDMDEREYEAGMYAAYAVLQYALASHYFRKGDHSRACLHVATSETYWKEFEKSGWDDETWREIRSSARDLSRQIVNKGIIEGTYVQGSGIQTWIGKVLSIEGGTIRVRVTYVINSGLAPRGFRVGKDISVRRDEIEPVKNFTVGAVGSALGIPGF